MRYFPFIVLVIMDAILFFLWSDPALICLFSFGFIWNWTAAQDLTSLLSNPRYKFSMVRFVKNLEGWALKPFSKLPSWTHFIGRILPAGIFWCMVIYINESDMPWYMTFVGSLCFEITQFEISFLKKNKEEAI
jgi:hypothetical protein